MQESEETAMAAKVQAKLAITRERSFILQIHKLIFKKTLLEALTCRALYSSLHTHTQTHYRIPRLRLRKPRHTVINRKL